MRIKYRRAEKCLWRKDAETMQVLHVADKSTFEARQEVVDKFKCRRPGKCWMINAQTCHIDSIATWVRKGHESKTDNNTCPSMSIFGILTRALHVTPVTSFQCGTDFRWSFTYRAYMPEYEFCCRSVKYLHVTYATSFQAGTDLPWSFTNRASALLMPFPSVSTAVTDIGVLHLACIPRLSTTTGIIQKYT